MRTVTQWSWEASTENDEGVWVRTTAGRPRLRREAAEEDMEWFRMKMQDWAEDTSGIRLRLRSRVYRYEALAWELVT